MKRVKDCMSKYKHEAFFLNCTYESLVSVTVFFYFIRGLTKP